MRHVRKRRRGSAAVAVAAMLAGVGYRRALEIAIAALLGGEDPVFSEMVPLLKELTGRPWKSYRVRVRTLEKFRPPAEPCAVLIAQLDRKLVHCIAVDGGMVYDPECMGPHRLNASRKRQGWLVLRVVRPHPKRPI